MRKEVAAMTATTTKEFTTCKGKVLPTGSRVSVLNLYKKEAIVDHVEKDGQHTWYRLPRRILMGISKNSIPERG